MWSVEFEHSPLEHICCVLQIVERGSSVQESLGLTAALCFLQQGPASLILPIVRQLFAKCRLAVKQTRSLIQKKKNAFARFFAVKQIDRFHFGIKGQLAGRKFVKGEFPFYDSRQRRNSSQPSGDAGPRGAFLDKSSVQFAAQEGAQQFFTAILTAT